MRTYDDDPTKYQDLRVGRIDAILVDRLAALDLVKKTNDTLAVTGEAFSRQESGVALRKGNEDLLKSRMHFCHILKTAPSLLLAQPLKTRRLSLIRHCFPVPVSIC